MRKRKLEVDPQECALMFKKSKFDNANDIVKVLQQLEHGSPRRKLDCILALTDIAVLIIRNGDGSTPEVQKPDDLKNALEKYQEWTAGRLDDIIRALFWSLHSSKNIVSQYALRGIMTIIKQKCRTEAMFPFLLYAKLVKSLLSCRVDCRKLIQSLAKPLTMHDLSYFTMKVLGALLKKRGDNTSAIYKVNLVELVLLLRMPPRVQPVPAPPLWCCRRKAKISSKKRTELTTDKKPDIKVLTKKQLKKKTNEHSKDHRKSKYEELLKGETIDKDEDNNMSDGCEDEQESDCSIESATEEQLDEVPDEGNEEEEERKQRMADNDEFTAGRKVKKPRRGRGEESSLEGLTEAETAPENANDMPLGELVIRPVKNRKRMLPEQSRGCVSLNGNEEDVEFGNDEVRDMKKEEQEDSNKGPVFKFHFDDACSLLSLIWERLMSFTLTEDQCKRCLVHIPDHVMEFLHNPISLTDFFMSSYNFGGATSLLAIQGVYLLMNKHNLQYPDFYPKLYRLLEPSVCNARFKPRFFSLLNIFLSSTHLPEYIAAAFVKRLARLALFAPANCTVLVVKIINNLLARFSSLRRLFDDENETAVNSDPFKILANDLMKTDASQSSLWELMTLNKSAPQLLYKSTLVAKRVHQPEEVDISAHLETLYDELDPSTAETANQLTKVTDNFLPVTELFNNKESNLLLLFNKLS